MGTKQKQAKLDNATALNSTPKTKSERPKMKMIRSYSDSDLTLTHREDRSIYQSRFE